jgi:hypothetical protein
VYGDLFYRIGEARRWRKLQRIGAGMPDYLLRDVGFERDAWGRIYRAPVEPKK